jgi:cytochrome P450
MKDPFLSNATKGTVEMVEEHVQNMVTFSTKENRQLEWGKAARPIPNGSTVEVDLFPLIVDFVAHITSTVLMGSSFTSNNPEMIRDLWTFDSGLGALLTGIPLVTPGLTKARAARVRINAATKEWGQAMLKKIDGEDIDHKWGDLSDVSETMVIRMKALKAANADEDLMVASILAIYWGAQVNANKVIFWMLLRVVSSPELLATIRTEIAPYSKTSPAGQLELDVDALGKVCPVFKATFFETMRLYVATTSYKKVLEDFTLTESAEDASSFGKPMPQTYHISTGDFLVIPHETMQTDPRLWKEPAVFDPYRFIVPDERNPGKIRADSLHLNTFGGGPSVCKGRSFAEREVLIFVAGILATWDFKPTGSAWKIPAKSYNGTGSANPKGAVRVRMSRRKE